VLSWFVNSVRLDDASGVAVAKFVSAKFRGVRLEVAKSILENLILPKITSGALPMVVVES